MHLPRLRSLALRAALSVLVSALTPLVFAQSPAEVFQRAGHSVGIVLVGNMDGKLISAGSAVAVDPRLMVTNFHVVTDRASRIYVFLNSRRYEATVFRCEKEQDLCLIDVQGLDVPPVELGNADDLKVGDTTFAIGGPNELMNAFAVSAATNQKQLSPPQVTLSQGMVTALRPLADGMLIQTSAPISPGSSGGGLFDAKGRLIGITTFQMKNNQAVNFALPVAWVRRMGVSGGMPATEIQSGSGGLGASSQDGSSALASALNDLPENSGSKNPPRVQGSTPAKAGKAPRVPLWPALLVALLVLVVAISWLRHRRHPRRAMEMAIVTSIPADAPDPEQERWAAQVAAELARGEVDAALWASIQPYAVGEPEKAKALYSKRRIPQLIKQEKERLWHEAVARAQGTPPPPPAAPAIHPENNT